MTGLNYDGCSGEPSKVTEWKVNTCLTVINLYRELLDSYVLDFYVDNLWETLPQSWQALKDSRIEDFSIFLTDVNDNESIVNNNVNHNTTTVFPLSLLSIRALTKYACAPRRRRETTFEDRYSVIPVKLKNELTKRVKPKKLHEIKVMTQICEETFNQKSVNLTIDFGSGIGHLARHLCYGCKVDVCCIEQQAQLVTEAKRLDELIRIKYVKLTANEHPNKIIHINQRLSSPFDFQEVSREIMNLNKNEISSFGLVGLHPCGDLAVFLLQSFLSTSSIQCINIASCCYMKLTTAMTVNNQPRSGTIPLKNEEESFSYPLSRYVKLKPNHHLSYQMLEVACHANEKYAERLRNGDYNFLKVHSYRAALEAIIVKYHPELKHVGLRSVQHSNTLSFKDYCERATFESDRIQFKAPLSDIESNVTQQMLKQWKKVVIYHILRLILAPFVESVILFDRVLYLKDNNCEVRLIPAFDPSISPRCHVLTAVKRD